MYTLIVPQFHKTQNRHHERGLTCTHFTNHRLTCDDYDVLRQRADGCCEICRTPEEETGREILVIDHFEAGLDSFVRGLLCDRCNAVMSCFDGNKVWGDNRRWEAKAREYERNSFQRPSERALALMAKRTEMFSKFDPRYKVPEFTPVRLERSRPKRKPKPKGPKSVRIPLDQGQVAIAEILRHHLSSQQVARLVKHLAGPGQ
jgi:hypothetical protein